jgi:leucyl aminopeptidase
MNFELQAMDLVDAADEKCDALLVLVPKAFKASKDDLSQLVGAALKAGDLEVAVGKTVSLYRPLQAAAVRVVLCSVGEGTARQVRTAVSGAVAACKSTGLKKMVVCFAAPATQDAVRAAVLAVADMTYSYTTTKSKPQPRSLDCGG